MSYGIEEWGIGSWGGLDFVVTDHFPNDFATGVDRSPLISFTLLSQSGDIILSSINLIVNGVPLITNGVFTVSAIGNIDDTIPAIVHVTAQILYNFSSFELVTVAVAALNTSNQVPAFGDTWQFNVNSAINTFQTYTMRNFERVFRVNTPGLASPLHLNTETIATGLKLFWDNVQNAVGYNIYWLTSPGVTIISGNLISGISNIYYNHINLLSTTTYYYIVVALDSSGNFSTPSIEFSGTTS